jgi:hypothetical protein
LIKFYKKEDFNFKRVLEILGPLKRYNKLGSMFIIHVIDVIKASDNN